MSLSLLTISLMVIIALAGIVVLLCAKQPRDLMVPALVALLVFAVLGYFVAQAQFPKVINLKNESDFGSIANWFAVVGTFLAVFVAFRAQSIASKTKSIEIHRMLTQSYVDIRREALKDCNLLKTIKAREEEISADVKREKTGQSGKLDEARLKSDALTAWFAFHELEMTLYERVWAVYRRCYTQDAQKWFHARWYDNSDRGSAHLWLTDMKAWIKEEPMKCALVLYMSRNYSPGFIALLLDCWSELKLGDGGWYKKTEKDWRESTLLYSVYESDTKKGKLYKQDSVGSELKGALDKIVKGTDGAKVAEAFNQLQTNRGAKFDGQLPVDGGDSTAIGEQIFNSWKETGFIS